MQQSSGPDPFNAFVSRFRLPGADHGPLAGLSFAVKDLFDIQGQPTTGGTPDWNPDRTPAAAHAGAVQALLDAGATCIGRTVTDEVSLGLMGENAHHGPVANPRAPGRVPGGSSSGSAASVAGGLADLALGTDTGGSVRVPASFCGLFGLRPTHEEWGTGSVSKAGMLDQAPSFDTAGFFADRPEVFVRAADVLLGRGAASGSPSRLFIAPQAMALADPAVRDALAPALTRAAALIGAPIPVELHPMGLEALLSEVQAVLQPAEARATFDDWLDRANPRLSWQVAAGRARSQLITREQVDRARPIRAAFRRRLADLLAPDAVLAIPSAPFAAPLQGLRRSAMAPLRARCMMLTCPAGLSGVPQISLPLGLVDGLPVGLGFLAAPGREDLLMHLALALGDRAEPPR